MGIDPGISCTGFGVVDMDERGRLAHVACGSIQPPTRIPFVDRLLRIHLRTNALLRELQPEQLAMEEVFFARNPRSALVLGQARGVVLLSAALAGVPVFEYAATEAKKAVCGYGGAEKRQVGIMVKALLGLKIEMSEHAADALALCICHAHTFRGQQSRGMRPGPAPGSTGKPGRRPKAPTGEGTP